MYDIFAGFHHRRTVSESKMLGLDRKKMEEERLARISKRKRDGSISPPPLKREKKESPQVLDGGIKFPNGVVRRTWSAYHPRTENDIKIEEVLERDKLKTAILSSYLWDTEWIFTKISPSNTKIIFVMGTDEATMRQEEDQAVKLGIKMCFAKLPQGSYSKMHSKLMLLFYADFLRIAIPSANLMPYDWGETGVMENMVYLIDLPRHADGRTRSKEDLTFFGRELMFFLDQMGLWDKAREGILNFDFSKTEKLAFIHSMAGTHYGEDMQRTGFVGLGRAIRELKLDTEDLRLDYASASVGNLDSNMIGSFYHSCRGIRPEDLANQENSAAFDHFNVYFPTFDTVRQSIGGMPNAGTICIQRRWWESKEFPRSMFKDYQSTREGLLSHNKTLLARGLAPWVYVGSSNLSASAWGRVSMDRKKKEQKLTCANWECGVLVPGRLDVPWKEPAKKYKDEAKPWYFMEHMED